MPLAVVELVAFAAATLSGVTGFGGATLLLSALVLAYGPRAAVPILTVAQLVGNASRAWFNRKELDLRVVGWFAVGGVPAALAGGYVFAAVPLPVLNWLIGVFLLVSVGWRHVRAGPPRRFSVRWFAAVGAASSFLSALVGTAGPLAAPFLLAFGLVRGAYVGTDALATVVLHTTKVAAYAGVAVLGGVEAVRGLALAPAMVLGSYVGKRILNRVPERVFAWLIDVVMLVAGLRFILAA
ncbi:MAG: sulfite exporter TauE/SafE family protein [Gemmatimonadetes bacterium]|nr:sulfite exporter TauE/SafE family protein [Gemmatimonadota bacterium]